MQIKKAWPSRNPPASAVPCLPNSLVTMQRPFRKSDFWKGPVTRQGRQPEGMLRKSFFFFHLRDGLEQMLQIDGKRN